MTAQNPADGSVSIFCLMQPGPGQAVALREGMLALVAPTRAEPGCLAYDVYEEADGSLVLFETWRSQAELAAHQQQPAIKAFFGDQLHDLLARDMTVHYGTLLAAAA